LVLPPAWHAPPWQVPWLHAVPSGFAVLVHLPVPGSQAPASWHSSGAAQLTPAHALLHTPPWQVPPLQSVPSFCGGFEHFPEPGSQVPTWWHPSVAVQVMPVQALGAPHVPWVQTSLPVPQTVPSILFDQPMVDIPAVHT
jgi:hypothetical protein